jgi:antitoxin (DNA-binding transcriptional repressor) of toxin-antitoxin stability system
MSTISVQDLQRDLLAFLKRVEAGESFLIVSGGQPLAEVRPAHSATTQPRPFGLCAGQFRVPPDFDQPLPEEILNEFEQP